MTRSGTPGAGFSFRRKSFIFNAFDHPREKNLHNLHFFLASRNENPQIVPVARSGNEFNSKPTDQK